MEEIVFNNASRKIIRIFFVLTLIFAAAAVVPQVVLRVQAARGMSNDSLRDGCNIISLIMVPLGIAMLLSALLTIPTARQTDRTFKAFREGDLLARWEYEPAIWSRFIQTTHAGVRKAAWWIYALIFAPSTGLVLYLIWDVQETLQGRIKGGLIAIAAVIACSGLYYLIARWIIGARIKAMTACPRAFIGRSAAYAGGMFNFWGSQLRGLQSARILPGPTPDDPHILELIVGLSRGAKKAMSAFDVINLLTLKPSYTASTMQRLAILIPPGEEARAGEIAGILVQGSVPIPHPAKPGHEFHPSAAQSPAPLRAAGRQPVPIPAGPFPIVKPHVPPDAASLRRRSRFWGIATVLLFVGGLILFLAGDHGQSKKSNDALAVLGLLAWVAVPITLILWIVQNVRARRAARMTGQNAATDRAAR